MRCLVLALLLLALPLSWGWAGPVQTTGCAGAMQLPDLARADAAGHADDGHHDAGTGTAPAPCAHGCSSESSPCAGDCPCQGHTQSPGALHYRPAPLHAVPSEPGASEHTRTVPEPFVAAPLRPPSARQA